MAISKPATGAQGRSGRGSQSIFRVVKLTAVVGVDGLETTSSKLNVGEFYNFQLTPIILVQPTINQ